MGCIVATIVLGMLAAEEKQGDANFQHHMTYLRAGSNRLGCVNCVYD